MMPDNQSAPAPVALACELCRKFGKTVVATQTDPDIGPVCQRCIPHVVVAVRSLVAAKLTKPTPELRALNP
jgi:hypothetical protein